MLCPLPHSELFQLMMKLSPDDEPELSERDIQKRWLAATGLKSIRLRDPTWLSVFTPNVRMVTKYRMERVFLAGDAAHVHTPAGAQGLNTGIQDAYNLGWKLSLALRGAPEALLDTYEEERMPVAAAVLSSSTKLFGGHKSHGGPKLTRGDAERQLRLNYRGSSLAMDIESYRGKLKAGDRAPDALCDGASRRQRFFDLFRGPHFTLLAFGDRASAAVSNLRWPQADMLRMFTVLRNGTAEEGRTLIDTNGAAHAIYGVANQDNIIVLVRPDGYIGLITNQNWMQALSQYQEALACTNSCAKP